MPGSRNVRALVAAVLFVSACTQRLQGDETRAPRVAPVALAPAVVPPVVPSALGVAVPDASPSPPLADEDDPRSCRFKVPEQSCIPGTDQVDWSCRSTAFAICTRAAKCMTACRDEDEHGPCHAACERRLAAGCDRAFLDEVEMGICNPYDLSP